MQTPPRPIALLLRGGAAALLALTLLSAFGVIGVQAGPARPAAPHAQPANLTPTGPEVFYTDYHLALLLILSAFAVLTVLLLWATLRRARASRKARRLDSRTLWTLSIGFSVLCALAVLAIWLVITLAPFPQGSGDPILSQSDLDHYLAARPSATAGGPRILIPTGVFIQSIKFDSAFDPVVSGYVWQVYGPDVPQDVTRGFILPDGDDIQSAEAYRETRGGAQVIGWSFQATLRQEFLYNNYPFDRHYLWVRVDPADVSHNIMLTPDFPSYSTLRPTDLPGVQPKLILEDWQVRQAFFSYHTNLYNTNLGVGDLARLSRQPELYYSVGLSRHILGAFITYIIPPLVALIMLFGVLILTTRRQTLRDSAGWSSTNVLAYTAALFFVIIVSHVNLRQQVSANGVLYLGWFYILTYLAILLVSINAVVFILASERQLIQREDNLVSKLLYWPVFSFALLVITVVVFI